MTTMLQDFQARTAAKRAWSRKALTLLQKNTEMDLHAAHILAHAMPLLAEETNRALREERLEILREYLANEAIMFLQDNDFEGAMDCANIMTWFENDPNVPGSKEQGGRNGGIVETAIDYKRGKDSQLPQIGLKGCHQY